MFKLCKIIQVHETKNAKLEKNVQVDSKNKNGY